MSDGVNLKRIKDLNLQSDVDEGVYTIIDSVSGANKKYPLGSLISSIAPIFDSSVAYNAGDYCNYNGQLYEFDTDHAAGEWTGLDVSTVTISQILKETSDALSGIQQLLGNYGAQWELINNGSFTNAEEADYNITTGSDNKAFELTDIRFLFWLPQQETAAGKGDFGRIHFYYDALNADTVFCGAWTQAANAAGKICGAEIIQEHGMVNLNMVKNIALNSENPQVNTMRAYPNSLNSSQIWSLVSEPRIYSKISITKVTGTGCYALFGRRKTQ